MTGNELLRQVHDVLADGLPTIPEDDKHRDTLEWFKAELGRRLGIPPMEPEAS